MPGQLLCDGPRVCSVPGWACYERATRRYGRRHCLRFLATHPHASDEREPRFPGPARRVGAHHVRRGDVRGWDLRLRMRRPRPRLRRAIPRNHRAYRAGLRNRERERVRGRRVRRLCGVGNANDGWKQHARRRQHRGRGVFRRVRPYPRRTRGGVREREWDFVLRDELGRGPDPGVANAAVAAAARVPGVPAAGSRTRVPAAVAAAVAAAAERAEPAAAVDIAGGRRRASLPSASVSRRPVDTQRAPPRAERVDQLAVLLRQVRRVRLRVGRARPRLQRPG